MIQRGGLVMAMCIAEGKKHTDRGIYIYNARGILSR